MSKTSNVLFLCTGNTARSILAEGILRKDGAGRFVSFSAGSQPKGVVNPYAVKTLEQFGYPRDGYRSKSWDELALPGAPRMDFIFTVCDNAAGEACPVWPGHPAVAHWGVEDPAAVDGSDADKERAFAKAFRQLRQRITAFIDLPVEELDGADLKRRLGAIGGAVSIRAAHGRDVAAITAIYAEHVLGGTGTFDTVPRTEAATLSKLEECQRHAWPFLVAERDGMVLGYAYATQFRDRSAYAHACENSIYVKADQTGGGIGSLLLGRLCDESERVGFRQMIAVVGGGEAASVALHESQGFRISGRMTSVGRKFGRWLDTVYLQRSLGAGDKLPPPVEPK